jgi:ribulose-phosphate 3-epimerase
MSAVIAPTITAYDLHEYREQMERVKNFSTRLHVDLMDGVFAPTKSPDIDKLWLPKGPQCDVHIMFQHPDRQIKKVLALGPSLIIIQAEADKESVRACIRGLKKTKVKVGVSLLAATKTNDLEVRSIIHQADYVLIFSGNLGFHGGQADLSLLSKIPEVRAINPTCEIAWDGGVSIENAKALADAGITVLNTGGAVQKATDPEYAYRKLSALVA